ncbi:hypothetical protein EG68_05454 [Paragonimus skrjabini miyazakii]|uniref:Uncharacterized protein n=1 Tax=Paragonimus skrjabini miyazakii TaxID=59628 RepID=A0A8S9YEW2_9TREM|nr:hypothetical protein EG68_05454 [Paragonimus skrjabini miyazakii]
MFGSRLSCGTNNFLVKYSSSAQLRQFLKNVEECADFLHFRWILDQIPREQSGDFRRNYEFARIRLKMLVLHENTP